MHIYRHKCREGEKMNYREADSSTERQDVKGRKRQQWQEEGTQKSTEGEAVTGKRGTSVGRNLAGGRQKGREFERGTQSEAV